MKHLLVTAFLLVLFACSQEEKSNPLPNIIWLVAEDQSP